MNFFLKTFFFHLQSVFPKQEAIFWARAAIDQFFKAIIPPAISLVVRTDASGLGWGCHFMNTSDKICSLKICIFPLQTFVIQVFSHEKFPMRMLLSRQSLYA